jgi:hypothetical protein
MTIAKEAFERGGYEITVELETSVDDLPIGADHISRRTTLLILVRNHRMGKVQVSAFYGEVEGEERYPISVIGEQLGYTFDGVSKQQWHAGSSEKYELPAPSIPEVRIRVGAELGDGEIIWSDWKGIDEKTAAFVAGPPT